jgi:RNA polymerase sigma-70 factor (ECF subfamily)
MVAPGVPDTDELLDRAGLGDKTARQRLLERHRGRLRRMVVLRLDRRLTARVDPSDVVQESLAEAARQLPDYLRRRPLPFYAWLRQLAWERIAKLHRYHIAAQRRSVAREETPLVELPDDSVRQLARRLLASGTSPSHQLLRVEQRERVRAALARLSERDREILALRALEQLSAAEVAALLKITERAAKARFSRALERLRNHLDDESEE